MTNRHIKHAQYAHTNITVLDLIANMLEAGYRGEEGIDTSAQFKRSVINSIKREQHRLLRVMDKHVAAITQGHEREEG